MQNNKKNILKKIKLPGDVKRLSLEQKQMLCDELRGVLLETVSETGGHLASNLGTVELTVAIHSVFSSPYDKILWDVGHQAYSHKILTGRYDKIATLRQEGGLSGFTKPSESEHDAFISGHSSTSISAACGIATAMRLKGDDHHVIAVIGDGAMTGGEAFEGLNNAGRGNENLIIILNQNNMSISKNVGAFAKYLNNIRTTSKYYNTKNALLKTVEKTPVVGKNISKAMHSTKKFIKNAIYHSNLFEDLGFSYFGPIDGHDMKPLVQTLRAAKKLNKPAIIHIDTVKGKGLAPAEENPGSYHGMPKCKIDEFYDDIVEQTNFSNVFGKKLKELADDDNRICAVTAAMKYGTGLEFFYKAHKDRFFDVGIAEQHAVTFSAGLAVQGLLPVFAVYSTFLQRAYDQVLHDAAIENTHIVLAIDRAGIVGADGATHQGLFDAAFLSTIPNTTILSPSTYKELEWCLKEAIYKFDGVVAVRYPRGECENELLACCNEGQYFIHEKEENSKVLLVTYGKIYENLHKAWEEMPNLPIDTMKLVKIRPFDSEALEIAKKYEAVIFFEEGIKSGGIGQKFECELRDKDYNGKTAVYAIDDKFVNHASVESSLAQNDLDVSGIKNTIQEQLKKWKIQ